MHNTLRAVDSLPTLNILGVTMILRSRKSGAELTLWRGRGWWGCLALTQRYFSRYYLRGHAGRAADKPNFAATCAIEMIWMP